MLSRWFEYDPVAETTSLRDAMNQLLEQAILRPGSPLGMRTTGPALPMDVYELNGAYVVQVLLPGINPDELEITAKQNTITLRGHMPELVTGETREKALWLLHELPSGDFTRMLGLPKAIDGDHVEAHYQNGLLTLHVPVAEHEMPKKITISGESQAAETRTIEPDQSAPQRTLADPATRSAHRA